MTQPWLAYGGEIFDGFESGVLIVDASGLIVFANSAAAELFHTYGALSLIGLPHEDEVLFPGARLRPLDGAGRPADGVVRHSLASNVEGIPPRSQLRFLAEAPGKPRVFLRAQIVRLSTDMGGLAGAAVFYDVITEEVARSSEAEWLQRELVDARQAVEELLRLSESLNTIGDRVHSTLDIQEVLEQVLMEAAGAIKARSAAIEVVGAAGWALQAEVGLRGELPAENHPAYAEAISESHQPLISRDAWDDRLFDPERMKRGHIRGFLGLPLIVRGVTRGVLSFHTPYRNSFTPQQVSFALKVATTVSLAMENAQAYVEERHIAETLQQALLVVPSAVPGLQSEHCYESATEAALIGGDFFDLFEIAPQRVGLTIGDVSGKGVQASALASFARQLVRAHAYDGASPAATLARTNDLVFGTSRPEEFVTLFFGILDLERGVLTYSSAGHPPPLVLRQGRATYLFSRGGGGPLLGAWPRVGYKDGRSHLDVGDILVLYTDGVLEARSGRSMLGRTRLRELVRKHAAAPLAEIAPAVLDAVHAFAGGVLRDDVAMLFVRRVEE